MGPPQAKAAIEECLAMGADDGIILSDRAFAAADTLATAYALAEGIKKHCGDFDLIFCGQKAIDAETGQVGIQVAELLDIPHIAYVASLEIDAENRQVRAKRLDDEGYSIVVGNIPILLTASKFLNEPRLPTLRGMISAKRKPIRIITANELGGDQSRYGLKGSPTIVSRVFTPPQRNEAKILSKDPEKAAEEFVNILIEMKIITKKQSN